MKKVMIFMLAALLLAGSTTAFASEQTNPVLISAPAADVPSLAYGNEPIASPVSTKVVDGALMVPLRAPLEAMGFTVLWHEETRQVEMKRGPQWSMITLGENAYFKNRMAPRPLSKEPLLMNGSTLVPLEFFVEVFDQALTLDSGIVRFEPLGEASASPVVHQGFVKSVTPSPAGGKVITLSHVEGSDDPGDWIILHTSMETTCFQREIAAGDFISALGAPFSTLSLPPQTPAYLIY